MTTEIVEYLQRLGLSEYQSRALVALFSRNDSNAKDISDISKIPHTRIYQVLKELEGLGLVTYTIGKPAVYRPVDPESVVNILLKKQKDVVGYLEKAKKNNLDIMKDLQVEGEEYQQNDSNVRMVTSKEGVWGIIDRVARKVKTEVKTLAPREVWYESYEQSESMLAWYDAVVKRGVQIRELFPKSINPKKILDIGVNAGWAFKRNWRNFVDNEKFHQRIIDDNKISSTIIIVDGKEVYMGLITPTKAYSTLIINEKNVVREMTRYFDMLWPLGEPFNQILLDELEKFVKKQGKVKVIGKVVKERVKEKFKV